MSSSLERRIQDLEHLYAMGDGPGLEPQDLEERRAAFWAAALPQAFC